MSGEREVVQIDGRGWTLAGRALDCRMRDVTPCELAVAIRRREAIGEHDERDESGVCVRCEPPGVVHEHVGVIHSGSAVDVRVALAAVARSRDVTVDATESLAAARRTLAAIEAPDVNLAAARERVAAAEAAADAVQADVAAARGAVQARADLDADVERARERLRGAVATASERETELLAAEQALARERERARTARDSRGRRLRLEDRVGRLERDEREALAAAVWGEFVDALAAVPDGDEDANETTVGTEPGSYDGDGVTAALAIVRIATVDAPVVLAVDRFSTAERARRVLDAPVVLATE